MKTNRQEEKLILSNILRDVDIPRMISVKQTFPSYELENVYAATTEAVASKKKLLFSGAKIAVAVGSRGIHNLPVIVRATIDELKSYGAEPFIVPAMGSHGSGEAKKQQGILETLGVTEEYVGAPIRPTMEVVHLGTLPNGLPVYMDKIAFHSDGIVVINRIKPHTAFRGPYESGLLKMITIGLGKQQGAESCHTFGFKHMAENIPAMAQLSIAKAPILFGVGVLEDAYDKTAKVVCLTPQEILLLEPKLLLEAKEMMAKIMLDPMDVLVLDEVGKEISGSGMDSNITGRYPTPYAHGGPEISKMLVLRLSKQTQGHSNGIGFADLTTEACVSQIDPMKGYVNGLTSTVVNPIKIPMALPSDRLAIRAAIKTSNCLNLAKLRLVRIKNTMDLSKIYVSETVRDVVEETPGLEIEGEPFHLPFDADGNLTDFEKAWHR